MHQFGRWDATGNTTGWLAAGTAHTALAGADWENQTLGKVPPPALGQNCHKQGRKTALGRKELLRFPLAGPAALLSQH